MNRSGLKGKIVEHGMTIGEFCEHAGFVRSTFDRKLNGPGEFTRAEIGRIIVELNLTPDETRNIFFAEEVT